MKIEKILIIRAIIFILIISSIIFFNNSNKSSTKIIKIDYNNSSIINSISIEHLVGTCPRNRECTNPSCSLWSDINKDGMCDRG